MAADAVGLAVTGVILRWAVPGRWTWGGDEGSFLWRARHDWRDLHYHLARLFIALLLIHLVLHRDRIVHRLRDLEWSR